MIFDYPDHRSHRRHGPTGYTDYESYRDWLRDEFCFRCVYCLKRETWGRVTGDFELDHFEPQSIHPEKSLDYLNLVYSCRTCNLIKSASEVDDPFETLHGDNLRCAPDGRLVAASREAHRMISVLDLNSPQAIEWRLMFSRIATMARQYDSSLYAMLIGFPRTLPDLARKQAPSNSRPKGVDKSWYAQRQRNELPEYY